MSASDKSEDDKATLIAPDREARVLAKVGSVLEEYCLSGIGKGVAMAYLRKMHDEDMGHVRGWWLRRMNGRDLVPPASASPWQRGCPELLEGLRAQPVWWRGDDEEDSSSSEVLPAELSWIRDLEARVPAIRAELLALRDASTGDGFQPYRSPGEAKDGCGKDNLGSKATDSGAWNVFYLELHNVDFEGNRSRCPETCRCIDAVPRKYGHAFFSAIAPATHIASHSGPTSKKLRCHLPLVVPTSDGTCRLRVADEVLVMREGKAVVFDDSFDHEAWNDDKEHARIVLVVDVWHPDLSLKEAKFLGFLQTAAMRRDKRLCEARGVDDENFYSVIDRARNVRRQLQRPSSSRNTMPSVALSQVAPEEAHIWS